jgi:LysR family glycine cleavage system transcriptional activator
MRRLPPLTQLRAFEAVARHASFKAAAAELAVTSAAISHQIRSLELFLGHPLVRRQPRPIQLTDAGVRLYLVLKSGFDTIAAALDEITALDSEQRLVVTTTNAFASRWLVPRLSHWRVKYPGIALEVIGTDQKLDLAAGEADVAIRYMFAAPLDLPSVELFRDRFIAVCSPHLISRPLSADRLCELSRYTLIHCYWSPADPHAPTWRRWLDFAASSGYLVPDLKTCDQLTFREELHGIEAAIAQQGILVISDALVARELDDARLMKATDITMPGYGFFLVHEADHPHRRLIDVFCAWALSQR